MSLITLTFGYGKERLSVFPHMRITEPLSDIEVPAGSVNKLQVKKVCQFYGDREVYVLGTVVSGFVGKDMSGKANGKFFDVVDMECKFPRAKYAKQGMAIGLFVKNISKEALENTEFLEFDPNETGESGSA